MASPVPVPLDGRNVIDEMKRPEPGKFEPEIPACIRAVELLHCDARHGREVRQFWVKNDLEPSDTRLPLVHSEGRMF